MLGLAPHTAALRRVKVRSADRDVLRVRQHLERALSSVAWMPAGLPPGAILLVRRLVAAPAEGAMAQRSFGERVSIALRDQAERARRPWLQSGVLDAEAVVFVDEAELYACLARDWLRGLVAQCWWWRTVLAGTDPRAWLRREAATRSEVLVPALSLLARRGETAAFVARLDADDCGLFFEAIVRSHAVPLAAASSRREDSASHAAASGFAASTVPAARDAIEAAPLRRLLKEAPEVLTVRSNPAQRRLLAFVLALIRAPTWVRTQAFGVALEALDRVDVEELTRVLPLPPESARNRSTVHEAIEATSAPVSRKSAEFARADETPSAPAAPEDAESTPLEAAIEPSSGPLMASGSVDDAPARREPVQERVRTPDEAPSVDVERREQPGFEGPPPMSRAALEAPIAPSGAAVTSNLEMAPRLETRFGGIFYLLNAALAMGLYADFTSPRAANLELSPWDWLAWIGREWFGTEFVEDPAWRVLAELAGRTPEDEPDREFHPPSETWLDDHLAILHARLAAAIDAEEGVDLPVFICRHDAEIEVSATTVHVFLSLAHLDLAIRIAGLDRDTGWIPAAGRAVRFHFD